MLVQCLYASRPTNSLPASQIESILEQSRSKNPHLGVTGILCFTNELFIQVLEGGRDDVCRLYNRIARDERHEDPRILIFEEIAERRFSNWTMGQVDISKVNQGLLLKYFERSALDPFACSGRATLAFIHELVASAAIVSRG